MIVAREWLRQDETPRDKVRRMVAIDGPNHGIINCSPSPLNYLQQPAYGGFTPDERPVQGAGLAATRRS